MKDIVNETTFERYLRRVMKFLILVGIVAIVVLMFILKQETLKNTPVPQRIIKSDIEPSLDSGKISFSTSSTKIVLAFTGDQGLTNDTRRALTMIKREGAQALIVLGDFDYQDKPDAWKSMLNTYLGSDFPIIPVAGNHEEKVWSEYSKVVQEQIQRLPKGICSYATTSDISLHYSCKLGPVDIVMSAPDIKIDAAKKVDSVQFMKKELARFNAGWKLCAWHKPHRDLQLGEARDDISWNLYTTCQKAGAYMLMGHDHSYARTKTMIDFPNRIFSTTTPENVVLVGGGMSGVVIAGLGGRNLHKRATSTGPWWASVYSAENIKIETDGKRKNIAGVLFCTFEKDKKEAPCYFKMTDGEVRDVFTIRRQ